MSTSPIHEVLKPLCAEFRGEADALLDLWEWARQQRHPGRCVGCYFRLFARAGDTAGERLGRLRQWLEHHLEVEARDENDHHLESLPVCLEAEDLEGFCHRTMREFLENRAYPTRKISLCFRFKQEVAA